MKEKMICRGDLFYYDFGDNSGSVQSGERPVLVVQADDYNQNAPTRETVSAFYTNGTKTDVSNGRGPAKKQNRFLISSCAGFWKV